MVKQPSVVRKSIATAKKMLAIVSALVKAQHNTICRTSALLLRKIMRKDEVSVNIQSFSAHLLNMALSMENSRIAIGLEPEARYNCNASIRKMP